MLNSVDVPYAALVHNESAHIFSSVEGKEFNAVETMWVWKPTDLVQVLALPLSSQ